jgi:hypothetical protein
MRFCARKLESMDKSAEILMRSTLHDMANILGGIRGILDLTPAEQPVSQRDRQRLDAVLEEGIATLERCRHLALETLPDGPLEPGPEWRAQLLAELAPMGTLFRSRFELDFTGAPEWDQWPGGLLRSYIRAVTRQVLPFARGGTLCLRCDAGADGWRLRWSPAPSLPESLSGCPDGPQLDICSRWALLVGSALGATLGWEAGAVHGRVPRDGSR